MEKNSYFVIVILSIVLLLCLYDFNIERTFLSFPYVSTYRFLFHISCLSNIFLDPQNFQFIILSVLYHQLKSKNYVRKLLELKPSGI